MNMYYLIFKILAKEILNEVINALAEFIRQVLRAIFFDEELSTQEQSTTKEPFE